MALKTCKDCGSPVSAKAVSCPKCGRPLKRKDGCLIWTGVILTIGMLVVMWHVSESVPENGLPSAVEQNFADAKAYVRKDLKAPATAEFSEIGQDNTGCHLVAGSTWEAFGTVDSQNSFGAKLREPWDVIWDVATRKILYTRIGETEIGDRDAALAKAKGTTE